MILRLVNLRKQKWCLPTLWSEEMKLRISSPVALMKAKTKLLYCTQENRKSYVFTATAFKRHTNEIINQCRDKGFLRLFFYLPSATDKRKTLIITRTILTLLQLIVDMKSFKKCRLPIQNFICKIWISLVISNQLLRK